MKMTRKDNMTTIFASWSHLDDKALSDLRSAAGDLSNPVEVCKVIPERKDWMRVAKEYIDRSDCVILILTANSAASLHCKREVAYAASIGKETLIWAPEIAPPTPDWARNATWLREQAIDAVQALTTTLMMLSRSLR